MKEVSNSIEEEDTVSASGSDRLKVSRYPTHVVCSSYESTAFRRLQPGTDLRVAPPNWLQPDPFKANNINRPGWTKLWRDRSGSVSKTMTLLEHAFVDRTANSENLKMHSPPDFIASAKCLKQLFSIPFTTKAVSVVIHRVGRTMLINAIGSAEHPVIEDHEMGVFQVGTDSILKAIDATDVAEVEHEALSDSGNVTDPPAETRTREKEKRYICEHKNLESIEHKDLESRFIYYSAEVSDQAKKETAKNSGDENQNDEEENNSETSWKGSYRRTIRWQFQDMSLLSGSNLVLFRDKTVHDHEFSVRLHDANERLPASRCLEFYLDNRLAGVEAIALCFHKRGFVSDYHIYHTDDILLIGDKGTDEDKKKKKKRTIGEIENASSNLLKFLRERCHPERSYWLFKETGSTNVIRFCELTSSMTQTEKGRDRWMYNMAMLCYRVAQQYNPARIHKGSSSSSSASSPCSAGSESENASFNPGYNLRHRELLLKSLELLDEIGNTGGPPRYILRAALHEQVANNYLFSVDPLVRTYLNPFGPAPTKEKRQEALRYLKYSLAHWENVRFFLQEDHKSKHKRQKFHDSATDNEANVDEVNRQAMKRLEDQVLICHAEAARQHQALGNLKEALKLITDGIVDAMKLRSIPVTLQDALSICGDVLLDLSAKISKGKSYIESDTSDLVLRLSGWKLQCASLLKVPLVIAENDIAADHIDLSLVEQLYANALQCFDFALKKENSNISGLQFKLANGWNELGKFYIIVTQKYCSETNMINVFKAAKESILVAFKLFRKSGDSCNAVACLCNLNHLYRNMGMAFTSPDVDWTDSTLFVEAIAVLQEAQAICDQKPKKSKKYSKTNKEIAVWSQRVDMELAMTHLAYGSQLKLNSKKLLEQNKTGSAKYCHNRAVDHLHVAITLYERYMDVTPAARKQVAAVHYHLGAHFTWLNSLPADVRDMIFESSHDRNRISVSLAKRHFRLALDNFPPGTPEYQTCEKEYNALLSNKR